MAQSDHYMEQSLQLLNAVYAQDNENVQAMFGLATFAESDAERLIWQRKIVRREPSALNCRLLSNVLNRIYGVNSQEHWSREVDRCLRRAE